VFIITLTFADKSRAGALMDGHNEWIQQGFADGVFLLVGSLLPNSGGMIVAHNTSREELDARVSDDPFVREGVVQARVDEVSPKRADARLQFLVA